MQMMLRRMRMRMRMEMTLRLRVREKEKAKDLRNRIEGDITLFTVNECEDVALLAVAFFVMDCLEILNI